MVEADEDLHRNCQQSFDTSSEYQFGRDSEVRVIDRMQLILIFCYMRARSHRREASSAFGSAQYLLPRLVGQGII